jgi:hypothetical protein
MVYFICMQISKIFLVPITQFDWIVSYCNIRYRSDERSMMHRHHEYAQSFQAVEPL